MTISEVHLEFKFRFDKIDSLNYPNFLPEEIDLLLNQAQDRYVKQRYGLNNYKRQSFEETQKRTEDLKNIVLQVNLTTQPYSALNIDTNARFIILPTDHWFVIWERATLQYIDCNNTTQTKSVEVRPIQHVEFDKVVHDAFKAPDTTKILRLMDQGKLELITAPNTSVVSYSLRYVKEPVRVSLNLGVTFELSDYTHSEIIDEAVNIALENIEAKRNPTFTPMINNLKE